MGTKRLGVKYGYNYRSGPVQRKCNEMQGGL